MKIALIKPPATYADWYQRPQLGIAYLAAHLEEAGFECRIFDSLFSGWNEDELVEKILDYSPLLAAFSAMTHEIVPCARIAGRLKQAEAFLTVIGGCHFTALPEQTLREFQAFDCGIAGEGEKPLLELARRVAGTGPGGPIPGLGERTGTGKIVLTPPGPPLTGEELDRLPFPAFHLYYGQDRRALASPGTEYPILSSRGCPYHCAFCMQALGRRVRTRSAADICLEMEAAINNFGAVAFNFIDEIFLSDTPRTRELLEIMIATGLNRRARWSGLTRANLVTPDLIELAREAGCFRLEMGVESGDDEILKRIGKEITVSQVRRAAGIIRGAGIELYAYFILGHPGETPESLRRTGDLAVELNPDSIALGIMVPYPGTEICRMAAKGEWGYRLLSHDWERYDKYGESVLEIADFPPESLQAEQKRIMTRFFLGNRRYADLVRYVWKRRRAWRFFLGRRERP